MNIKICKVENKIPDITNPKFGKFVGSMFDTKLRQVNLATYGDLNAVSQRANKNKENIEKLQYFYLSYFLDNFSLLIMFFQICLFLSQYLVR